jgi:hypothetical protein
MITIRDLLLKIPGPMQVAMACVPRTPRDIPFKEVVDCMQLAYFWLRDAEEFQEKLSEGEVLLTEGESKPVVIDITLPSSVEEAVNFLIADLKFSIEMMNRFLDEVEVDPRIKIRVRNGTNKMTESLFFVKICKTYLEENEREHKQRIL